MPGSVKPVDHNALDAFPVARYQAYEVSHTRHVVSSEYPDGSTQRNSPVTTSTRRWRISASLLPAQVEELFAFHQSHIGVPFLFRDVHANQGLKAVFVSPWSVTHGWPRWTVSLDVEEIY